MINLIIISLEELRDLEKGNVLNVECCGTKTKIICTDSFQDALTLLELSESEDKEKPGKLKYVGYSSHDSESRYQCPVCKEGYGSWDFINGSVRVMNGLFRCKCGQLLKKPE